MEEKKNCWLLNLHIFKEVAFPLLEKGFISIGYTDFCNDNNFINEWKEKQGDEVKKILQNQGWSSAGHYASILSNFLYKMKKNDWVVISEWKKFGIYKIVNDKKFVPKDFENFKDWNSKDIVVKENLFKRDDSVINLGFFRKVETIVDMYKEDSSLNEYAEPALCEVIKSRRRGTLYNISNSENDIKSSIKAWKKKEIINIYGTIVPKSVVDDLLESIRKKLDPDKFRRLIQWYFKKIAATNIEIPDKNAEESKDYNLIADFPQLRVSIYVQAKFHEGEEIDSRGPTEIDEYVKYMENEDENNSAKIAWLLSSGDNFSPECEKQAEEAGIVLINGKEFAEMLLDAGFLGLDVS